MTVTEIVITIGKVSITGLCTALYYFATVLFFRQETISMFSGTLMAAVLSWLCSSQFFAPFTQAAPALLQSFMLDEELFFHNSDQRYAEKALHAWVDTYGGEFSLSYDVDM